MERPSWERVDALIKAALAIEDMQERDAFLVLECGSDLGLLAEVRRALAAAGDANSRFLEPPSMLAFDLTGRTVDEFDVMEEVGRGSTGVVYRATQQKLGRVVALKVLPLVLRTNDATAERFRREAIAAAKLRHPGIASVIKFGEVDGTFYYAMEFVDGPSLRDVMDRAWRGRELPIDPNVSDPRAIARLVAAVADALHFVHEGHVVHRDVKPHNILLERDGRPRLIDFGLAKLLDLRPISLRGDLIGTMYYMSPEQTRAQQEDVDRRSDVFSLGVVLYELLAHRRPFEGTSHVEIFKSITEDDAPSMRQAPVRVPRDLETICRHALEKLPGDRYQTAREFAEDLRRFLNGEPIRAQPLPPVEKLRRVLVKRRTVLTAVPLALAVGAGVMYKKRPTVRTFPVDVRTFDGGMARLLSRQYSSAFEHQANDTIDHGRGSQWSIELPYGAHHLEVVASDGSFASWKVVPSNSKLDNSFRVKLLAPRQLGSTDSDWSYVAPGRVEFQPLPSGQDHPVLGNLTGTSHAGFLVDRILVSNGDFRRLQRDGWTPEYPKDWGELARVWREEDPTVHDQRPLVCVNGHEAQRIAVELGGRLPSFAEAISLVTAGSRWWENDPAAVDDLVLGRASGGGPSVQIKDYLAGAVGVRDRGPAGPLGMHHPIGNVSIWTDTMRIDAVTGVHSELAATHGRSWWQAPATLDEDVFWWSGMCYFTGGNLDLGLRRVRSLAPELQ